MAWTLPLNIMGTVVQGDLADHTIYTDRHGKKVFFQRTKPDDPPSYGRSLQRARFVFAQKSWNALLPDQKKTLEMAVARTSLVMTGQNLFISCTLTGRDDIYHTVGRQAMLVLPPLPQI
jgi:hypothetical protein